MSRRKRTGTAHVRHTLANCTHHHSANPLSPPHVHARRQSPNRGTSSPPTLVRAPGLGRPHQMHLCDKSSYDDKSSCYLLRRPRRVPNPAPLNRCPPAFEERPTGATTLTPSVPDQRTAHLIFFSQESFVKSFLDSRYCMHSRPTRCHKRRQCPATHHTRISHPPSATPGATPTSPMRQPRCDSPHHALSCNASFKPSHPPPTQPHHPPIPRAPTCCSHIRLIQALVQLASQPAGHAGARPRGAPSRSTAPPQERSRTKNVVTSLQPSPETTAGPNAGGREESPPHTIASPQSLLVASRTNVACYHPISRHAVQHTAPSTCQPTSRGPGQTPRTSREDRRPSNCIQIVVCTPPSSLHQAPRPLACTRLQQDL